MGFDSASPLIDSTKVKDFSQEIRIASDGGGAFNYVAGLFFQNRKRDYTQNGLVPGADAHVGAPATNFGTPDADQLFFGTQNVHQKQYAVFGEISYSFAPELTATVGLRAFKFKEDYETYSSGLLNGGSSASTGSFDESGVTPKFNLSYSPNDDHLIYAEASKGFRLGGVNTTVPVDLCRSDLNRLGRTDAANNFDSDSLWNFEVGTKSKLDDGRFTLNASAYYIKWQDIQTTLSLPSCSFSFRTNAGKARSLGLELEARVAPTSQTEFYATLGITDVELTQDVPFTTWQRGDKVPSVSPIQVSLGVRQAFDLFGQDDSFFRVIIIS